MIEFVCKESKCSYRMRIYRSSQKMEIAERHYNLNHTFKDHKVVDDIYFYYFETESNYKLFATARHAINMKDGFIIPGWYGVDEYYSEYESYIEVKHCEVIIDELNEKSNEIQNTIEGIKGLTMEAYS